MKLESQNKGNIQLKLKYDELKATSVAKDELITRLENEMREQMVFVDKTIKVLYNKLKLTVTVVCGHVVALLFMLSTSDQVAWVHDLPGNNQSVSQSVSLYLHSLLPKIRN